MSNAISQSNFFNHSTAASSSNQTRSNHGGQRQTNTVANLLEQLQAQQAQLAQQTQQAQGYAADAQYEDEGDMGTSSAPTPADTKATLDELVQTLMNSGDTKQRSLGMRLASAIEKGDNTAVSKMLDQMQASVDGLKRFSEKMSASPRAKSQQQGGISF